MKKSLEPILFFGNGPVAAKSLQSLQEDFIIQGVITKPAPAHHHGDVPVAKFAQENGLKTYLVRDKKELNELFSTNNTINNVRLGILVDFGIIIPEPVLERFELGIVNSHFSLLPQWRGADPITFAILSGQQETGVSLMIIVKAMDEGPILAQRPYQLKPDMTTPELTRDLVKLSNSMLALVLPLYIEGRVSPVPQDITVSPSYSRKLTKKDGIVNWEKPAMQLAREIRAFIGWPRSHATIHDVQVIITSVHVTEFSGRPPGSIENINKQLIIYCQEQSLAIDRLRPASKGEMSGSDFLRGYPLK